MRTRRKATLYAGCPRHCFTTLNLVLSWLSARLHWQSTSRRSGPISVKRKRHQAHRSPYELWPFQIDGKVLPWPWNTNDNKIMVTNPSRLMTFINAAITQVKTVDSDYSHSFWYDFVLSFCAFLSLSRYTNHTNNITALPTWYNCAATNDSFLDQPAP